MSTTVRSIIIIAISLAITAGLVAVGYSWGKAKQLSKDQAIQAEYVQQVDSLNQVINAVYSASVEANSKCDSLQLELNKLTYKSQEIKRYYDAKIRDIASYNNAELQRFFTDRYSSR